MEPHLDFSKASEDFSRTIRQYLIYQKKELAEALNKKAKDVVFRAIRHTKKAEREAVKASLENDRMKYKLVSKPGVPRKETGQKAKRILSARLRSIGYLKAGWYRAAMEFGGRGGRLKPGGLASQGSGTRATTKNLVARAINKSHMASVIGKPALALAMREVQADMMRYIRRKMRESWGKAGRR